MLMLNDHVCYLINQKPQHYLYYLCSLPLWDLCGGTAGRKQHDTFSVTPGLFTRVRLKLPTQCIHSWPGFTPQCFTLLSQNRTLCYMLPYEPFKLIALSSCYNTYAGGEFLLSNNSWCTDRVQLSEVFFIRRFGTILSVQRQKNPKHAPRLYLATWALA